MFAYRYTPTGTFIYIRNLGLGLVLQFLKFSLFRGLRVPYEFFWILYFWPIQRKDF